MGYTTEFHGALKFTKDLTAPELAYLSSFLGEDAREHPEWIGSKDLYYIQFGLLKDFSGIEWDGSEKFYNATACVNLIIANMQAKYPDFGLQGQIEAQGEDYEDRWILRVVEGKAVRVDQPHVGDKITCPHCEQEFVLEETA